MLHISELKQFEICSTGNMLAEQKPPIIFIVGSSVDTATTESSTTHTEGKNNVVSKLKQQFDKRIWARFILWCSYFFKSEQMAQYIFFRKIYFTNDDSIILYKKPYFQLLHASINLQLK